MLDRIKSVKSHFQMSMVKWRKAGNVTCEAKFQFGISEVLQTNIDKYFHYIQRRAGSGQIMEHYSLSFNDHMKMSYKVNEQYHNDQ